jgi:hypothetical protein
MTASCEALLKLAYECGISLTINASKDRAALTAFARAITARERLACIAICEGLTDTKEQDRADAASRAATNQTDELSRLRHWSTVSTFNAGLKSAAAAIRERGDSPAPSPPID